VPSLATPIVFRGALYRFEWFRKKGCFQFIEHDTGRTTPPFAKDWRFGSAFVAGDTVYVTGTRPQTTSPEVRLFVSKDMIHWEDYPAVQLPPMDIWNTSICKAKDEYVLASEITGPAGKGPSYRHGFGRRPAVKPACSLVPCLRTPHVRRPVRR
jgi:hypothetical protein